MNAWLCEKIKSILIGTPLQKPAERLQWLSKARYRQRHPELSEIYLEPGRIREIIKRTVKDGHNCVDVGCHLGAVLQEFVNCSPSGQHIAIEPVPNKATWLVRKYPWQGAGKTSQSGSGENRPF